MLFHFELLIFIFFLNKARQECLPPMHLMPWLFDVCIGLQVPTRFKRFSCTPKKSTCPAIGASVTQQSYYNILERLRIKQGVKMFCCTGQSRIYCMDIWFGGCLPHGLDMAIPFGFTLKSTWLGGFVGYPFGVWISPTYRALCPWIGVMGFLAVIHWGTCPSWFLLMQRWLCFVKDYYLLLAHLLHPLGPFCSIQKPLLQPS